MPYILVLAVDKAEYFTHMCTLCLKNEPSLASCSFDKRGLILTIFGRHRQHTFRNDKRIQLSSSLQFYALYFGFAFK